MENALVAVEKGMSFRKAATMFDVKKSTLSDRFQGKHINSFGRPRVLTEDIELLIADMLDQISEWGYPCGRFEVQLIVLEDMGSRFVRVC